MKVVSGKGKTKCMATVNATSKSSVFMAENQGRVEVIFEYNGQRCRLLGDKDGIHVGTVKE